MLTIKIFWRWIRQQLQWFHTFKIIMSLFFSSFICIYDYCFMLNNKLLLTNKELFHTGFILIQFFYVNIYLTIYMVFSSVIIAYVNTYRNSEWVESWHRRQKFIDIFEKHIKYDVHRLFMDVNPVCPQV